MRRFALVAMLLAAGCGGGNSSSGGFTTGASTTTPPAMTTPPVVTSPITTSSMVSADYVPALTPVSPATVVPGTSTTFDAQIFDLMGMKLANFLPVHTQTMHMVFVSQDLEDFQHVHPTLQPSGDLTVDATLNLPEWYAVFMEYQPQGAPDDVLSEVVINTSGAQPAQPNWTGQLSFDGTTILQQTIGNTVVQLTIAPNGVAAVQSGVTAHVMLSVRDQSGGPANVQDWLGMAGHAIVLSPDLQTFLHLHALRGGPSSMSMPMGGSTTSTSTTSGSSSTGGMSGMPGMGGSSSSSSTSSGMGGMAGMGGMSGSSSSSTGSTPPTLVQDLQAASKALQATDPKLAGYLSQDAMNPSGKYVVKDLQAAAQELNALGGPANIALANNCLADAQALSGSSTTTTPSTTGTTTSGSTATTMAPMPGMPNPMYAGPTTDDLSFDVTLPAAGLYKVFFQFQRGGQVITAPFLLNASP
jgi:hypothetical protein